MSASNLCIIFNLDSIIGAACAISAQKRNYTIKKINYKKNYSNTININKKIKIFEKELSFLDKQEYDIVTLIYIPKLNEKDNTNLIPLSIAFSNVTKNCQECRIVCIGSVEGYDFNKIEKQNQNNMKEILSKSNDLQFHGCINSTTKFLAVNLANYNVRVNAAIFGPIEGISSLNDIKKYKKKSLAKLPISMASISNSIDIFLDPNNVYMTGQVIHFDGGVNIW